MVSFLTPAMVPWMFQLLAMAKLYLKKAVYTVLGPIVEYLSNNDTQDLNINYEDDITFEFDRNSGFVKTSSTLHQTGDADRESWLPAPPTRSKAKDLLTGFTLG